MKICVWEKKLKTKSLLNTIKMRVLLSFKCAQHEYYDMTYKSYLVRGRIR